MHQRNLQLSNRGRAFGAGVRSVSGTMTAHRGKNAVRFRGGQSMQVLSWLTSKASKVSRRDSADKFMATAPEAQI